MKPFLLILLVTANFSLSAQSLIAVDHNGSSQYYTNLDVAITDAPNGANIYVPGGVFPINTSITKELHFYGVGHDPDSTIATGRSQLIGAAILLNGSSNSSFVGLYINGGINFGYTTPQDISNVVISRCNLGGIYFVSNNLAVHYLNIIISENIISNSILGNASIEGPYIDIENTIVSNNIIGNYVQGFSFNCQFVNNIFLASYCNSFNFLKGCKIYNNMINTALVNSCGFNSFFNFSYCDFRNNLVQYEIPIGSVNTFNGNITSQPYSSFFVNAPTAEFSYQYDFNLQIQSPGINAGTDGTDIGIYGGAFPWKEGSIPINPHIQTKTISSTTDPSGNLPVNIKVMTQIH